MHLGDHLFFIPCIISLIHQGFDITVFPIPSMRSLFQALGIHTIIEKPLLSDFDLIISRTEFLSTLAKQKSILINITKNLTMPIADEIRRNITKLLCDTTKIQPFSLKLDTNNAHHALTPSKKYLVFNCYVNSGFYMITKKKVKTLINFAHAYALENKCDIIFIGSNNDKLKDKNHYPFSFVDLRGKTNIMDVFSLASLENVICYIGFDSFPMHVFSLLHKKSTVLFRGRIFQKQADLIKKYHINLFSGDCFVTLL